MKYSALIGNPTEHSVSHIMYEELAIAAGVKQAYRHLKIDVVAKELPLALSSFKQLNFIGINVTLPYKMEVMQYLDEVDETVNALGAVNTISFGMKTTGYNTDWIGIAIPIQNTIGDKKVGTVVIFGTGGAARTAIYAAKQLKAKEIIVLYRSSHAQALGDLADKSDEFGIKLLDYTHVKDAVTEANIIINATSAGMVGKDSTPFDLTELDGVELKNKIFLDAVFNPLQTPLMRHFHSLEALTIDGLWMMIHQGVAALSIWLREDVKISNQDLLRIHDQLEDSISHA
jgi:shikimate dehydrogenase